MTEIELITIGKRLRQARLNKEFTQQQLADLVGVDKSLISKIEKAQTNSALATLSKITKCLDVPLAWVLEEEKEENLTIISAEDRKTRIGSVEMGYMFETLANRSRFSKIEPVIVSVPPDLPTIEPFTHTEDEFVFVLEGAIELYYDGKHHPMKEGDSAYFEGTKPHIFLPVTKEEAKVLSVFIHTNS